MEINMYFNLICDHSKSFGFQVDDVTKGEVKKKKQTEIIVKEPNTSYKADASKDNINRVIRMVMVERWQWMWQNRKERGRKGCARHEDKEARALGKRSSKTIQSGFVPKKTKTLEIPNSASIRLREHIAKYVVSWTTTNLKNIGIAQEEVTKSQNVQSTTLVAQS